MLTLEEHHCNWCEKSFWISLWDCAERCPFCGSTDEFEMVKTHRIVIDEHKERKNQ